MKKLLKGLLAFAIVLVITGCGTGNEDNAKAKDLSEVKIGVIQLMQHDALDASYKGFKDELVKAGINADNIDYQVAGDQSNCTTVADKLVNGGNDLIYAIATPALQAVAAATTEIPIVGCAVTDYESTKLVKSNDKPGGNVTVEAAKEKGYEYKVYKVSDSNEIQAVASQIVNDKNDVVYIPTDNLLATYMSSVEAITSPAKIPCIVGEEGMVKSGGFATYGINYENLGREAGKQAVAILKGEKTAADTPIAQLKAEDCTLCINLKVAEACGLTINKDDYPDATFIEE